MKTIDQKQIDAELGKIGLLSSARISGPLTYEQGIPWFDQIIEKASWNNVSKEAELTVRANGLTLSIAEGFSRPTVGLRFSDIRLIELAKPEEIITKQEKSVLGRALFGGIILGPTGAILGAMSALDDKEKSGTVSLLTILVEQDGQEFHVVFSVKDEHEMVSQFLKKHLSQFYV